MRTGRGVFAIWSHMKSINPRVLQRLRGEYLEMPGLKLTAEQAQRLCGIDRQTCAATLEALVNMKFLCLRPDRTYVRATEGRFPVRATAATAVTPWMDQSARAS